MPSPTPEPSHHSAHGDPQARALRPEASGHCHRTPQSGRIGGLRTRRVGMIPAMRGRPLGAFGGIARQDARTEAALRPPAPGAEVSRTGRVRTAEAPEPHRAPTWDRRFGSRRRPPPGANGHSRWAAVRSRERNHAGAAATPVSGLNWSEALVSCASSLSSRSRSAASAFRTSWSTDEAPGMATTL
jgi:hypothetical protein